MAAMDSTGGARLAGMDSAGGESWVREEAGDRSEIQRLAEEIWQRHLGTLGKKERSALRSGGRDLKAEKQRLVDYHMRILFSVSRDERGRRLLQDFLEMEGEEERRREETRTAKMARKKELSSMRAAISAQHEGTGRPEEAVTVATSKSACEQPPLKGMPNKFDILDPDGDDDEAKSAIEEEHKEVSEEEPEKISEMQPTAGRIAAMDSAGVPLLAATGGESWVRTEARDRSKMQRLAEEIWQHHLATLGEKERSVLLAACRKNSARMRAEKQQVVDNHMRIARDSTGGALLAGMDSAGGESSMQKKAGDRSEVQRLEEEIWQRHLATLDKRERSALLSGGRDLTRMKAEKQRLVEKHMRILFLVSRNERGRRLLQEFLEMKREEEKRREETRTAKMARKMEHSGRRAAISAKKKKNIAQHEETARPEEAGTVDSIKSSYELTGKETSLQLLKSMPNKFDILDPDGDDDNGKSAIEEEEQMPSDGKNPNDRAAAAGRISAMDSTGGALLAATGGESSAREEARDRSEMQRFAEELWQRHLARLGEKERSAALRLGFAGGKDLLRREKHRVLEQHMRISFSVSQHKRGMRLMKQFWKMRDEELKRREEEEEESEKRSEMQPTATVPDFHSSMPPEYREIQRALLHIQDKLAKTKSRKMDKEILGLLNGISNMLDQGGDDGDSEDTNEGTNTTMVESDIKPAADPGATNSITIQDDHGSEMANRPGILHKLIKDLSDNFDISMRSAPAIQQHKPMVGSDKLMIEPADPSATDSVTRLGQYSLQDDLHHGKIAKKTADQEMADEAENFAEYCTDWESAWSQTCGSFEDMTALSSMQFTYYTPGRSPPNSAASSPASLQMFSIKLAEKAVGLKWPLSVYGVVAVRDVADHNRNFLFYCDRDSSQELTQNDPFLRLIGPSRAVVYTDKVNFEIELRVKGTTKSQDKALITEGRNSLEVFGHDVSTVCFENSLCKMELCAQVVERTIQATILGVQVVEGRQWPFKYGARVACSSLAGQMVVTEDNRVTFVTYPASAEIVMVDSKDGATLKGGGGYLHLPRNVVSVEDQGRLDVDIQAYSKSGVIAAQGHVSFPAKFSKITRKNCFLGGVKVVITVAWSQVVADKRDVMPIGCLV